jgi:hypothetical protein
MISGMKIFQRTIAQLLPFVSFRDPSACPMIFTLLNELPRASQGAFKSVSLTIISELLLTLEQHEFECEMMANTSFAPSELAESFQLATVNARNIDSQFKDIYTSGKIPVSKHM